MNLLLQALISLIQSEDIYVGNSNIKNQIETKFSQILKILDTNNIEDTVGQVVETLSSLMGEDKTLSVMNNLYQSYGNEMSQEEKDIYQAVINELKSKVNPSSGSNRNSDLSNRSLKDVNYPSTPNKTKTEMAKYLRDEYNSYSGADMVASITIPGKKPIIFGELANVSYSVMREKVPVRSLGRVSMRGYTRGMRTITGIMSFIVFDESVVYRCMEELKENGYRMLMDEMPLFDITLTMANEFGSKSALSIYGVSTFTEGMVMSVNDMMTQNVYEFYALDIDPIAKTI